MEKIEKMERNHPVFPKILIFGNLRMTFEVPTSWGRFWRGWASIGLKMALKRTKITQKFV